MCLGLDESFNTDGAQKTDPKDSPTSNGAGGGQWRQEYSSNDLTVWIKFDKSVSDHYSVRVKSTFNDVPLATLYDVLLDPEYRKTWDTMMIDSFEQCHLAPNTDIGYYSVRCPPPITNRDFAEHRRVWTNRTATANRDTASQMAARVNHGIGTNVDLWANQDRGWIENRYPIIHQAGQ